MRDTGIYQISIGNYFYIGQSQELKKRESQHLHYLKKGTHPNKFIQNVYDKHQDFHFQETIFCSVEELNEQEQRLLDMFWGTEGCMNLAKDAEAPARGLKRTEETRKKISEANKGKKLSEEHKKKLSEAKKGEKSPLYGKTGAEHPRYGEHHSEETKRKIGESCRDKTLHTFIHDEHGEVTCTPYELRKKYNLDSGHLSRLISAKLKSHKGWGLKNSNYKCRRLKGKNNPQYDHTLHTFIHEEHGEVTCTQYELRMKCNLNKGGLSNLISGKLKSTGGWRLK